MPIVPQKPPRAVCLKIAAAATCDPRTVAKYFERPAHVHPLAVVAVRSALASLGIPDPHAPALAVTQ